MGLDELSVEDCAVCVIHLGSEGAKGVVVVEEFEGCGRFDLKMNCANQHFVV